ncbi:MAG: hypothetical protein EPO67_18465 [Reyranella sp.]|nr:MAG: hypothetical protein EPO67_18465 [Reyranella sp.]
MHNLTLVHALLALAAAASIYLVVRELRRTYVSQWRLFAPGAVAMVAATGLMLLQIGGGQARWPFAVALVAGVIIGIARGLMIDVHHDLYQPQIIISRAARISFLCVALAIGGCVAAEIAGAFASPALDKVRLWAALIAVVCAVAMLGRALMLTIRLHRHS